MDKKRKVKIYDSAFSDHVPSASVGGDNDWLPPKSFEWAKFGGSDGPTFFTDGEIKNVVKYGAPPRAVAWLLEPYELRPENYEAAAQFEDYFDAILTHEIDQIETDKYRYYPYGGSWIDIFAWDVYPKSKLVSFIVTNKDSTEGHWLRQDILERFGEQLDVFGRDINPVERKIDALADYQYSIVVESSKSRGYFTEKLIDPISVGTIPIYWGDPKQPFENILTFDSLDGINGLDAVLKNISHMDLTEEAKRENIALAKQYAICEDWIFEHYPDLFEDK